MSAHNVARRYANALLQLCADRGKVDEVREHLLGLSQLIQDSAEFRVVLESPIFELPVRHKALRALSEHLKLSDELRSFLLLLADRKRLNVLPQIAEVFDQLADEHLGLLRARVETPVPLAAGQKRELVELLTKRHGKEVRLEERIDESILGGFRLIVGSTVHDATIDARLARLRDTIVREL